MQRLLSLMKIMKQVHEQHIAFIANYFQIERT